MTPEEAAERVFPGTLKYLTPTYLGIDKVLTNRGATRDVKTIYVSYTDESMNVVAAVHPDHPNHAIELAVALPMDYESDLLYDSVHLKWRTLPRALRVTAPGDLKGDVIKVIDAAFDHAGAIAPRSSDDFRGQRRPWRHSPK